MDLRIIYWNSRGIKIFLPELQSTLKKVDIFICVESYLNNTDNNSILNSSGFITLREDRTYTTGGGIFILIRKNLAFQKINLNLNSPQLIES